MIPSLRRIVYDCIRANPRIASPDIARVTGLPAVVVQCATYDMRTLLRIIRNVTPEQRGRAHWAVVPGSSAPSGRAASRKPKKARDAAKTRPRKPQRNRELLAMPECFLSTVWAPLDPALRPPAHAERV